VSFVVENEALSFLKGLIYHEEHEGLEGKKKKRVLSYMCSRCSEHSVVVFFATFGNNFAFLQTP
jgi:hypothetical protein